MRTASSLLAAVVLACSGTAAGQTIFACEPEWAALTRVLLPQAKVHVATHWRQDPHHIEARPALIAQVRSADAAICTGAGLESGWLPVLQQRAGNGSVQPGAAGMFYAATAVSLLDPRPGAGGNPFAGDVHAEGNPHFHLDPRRIAEVSEAWASRLQQLFPSQASDIARRQTEFRARWDARIRDWEQRMAPLKGRHVSAQHSTFAYLWRWLGIVQVADLEPQPGMPPTPGHLQALLDRLRAAPPAAVVLSSYQDPRAGRWLSQQLGNLRLVQLPATVEDAQQPEALERWMEQLLGELLKP